MILDVNEQEDCFGAYDRKARWIELYAGDIIGWLPWILKKTYLIPYSFIKEALGHEIDHHVNRQNPSSEKAAETTALKYVYPSLGIFQPLIRLASLLFRKKHSSPDG